MKDKIIIFIIGLLLGAIIATGSIYVYTVANNANGGNNQNMGMNGGTPPSIPNGDNGTPPEMPSGNNMQPGNTTSSN